MRWWKWVWNVLRRLNTRQPQVLKVREVAELPEEIDKRLVYVVGENGYRWFAALVCPCGCGEALYLNLLPEQHPCWKLNIRADGSVTFNPSIWRTKGCQSHFIIRNSKIHWCQT